MDQPGDLGIFHEEALERDVTVAEMHGIPFRYTYDMGDDWEHDITWLKDIEDYPDDFPKVLKFSGDCPPEDCGGIYGYYELMGVLDDPDYPDHEDIVEWLGDRLPYDVDEVNDYFRDGWVRSVSGPYLPNELLEEISEAFLTTDPAVYVLDTEDMEVVRIVDDNMDLGPYTAIRYCYSRLLTYRLGGRDREDVSKSLRVFSAIMRTGRFDEETVSEYMTLLLSVAIDDIGADQIVDMAREEGLTMTISIPDRSVIPEFGPQLVLEGETVFLG